MPRGLDQFRRRALARPDVRTAYDKLEEEFSFLREILAARADAGLTQTQVAARIGTTQSAIARLESGAGKHYPSIATLQRYARALGCRFDIRLVREGASRRQRKKATGGSPQSPRRRDRNSA